MKKKILFSGMSYHFFVFLRLGSKIRNKTFDWSGNSFTDERMVDGAFHREKIVPKDWQLS
jgi:hypothetical protein